MDKLKNMGMSTKQYGSFFIILFLSAFMGIISLHQLYCINNLFSEAGKKNIPAFQELARLRNKLNTYRVKEFGYVTSTDSGSIKNISHEMAADQREAKDALKAYNALVLEGPEKDQAATLGQRYDEYFRISNELLAMSRKHLQQEATAVLKGSSTDAYNNLLRTLDVLSDNALKSVSDASHKSNIFYDNGKKYILSVLLVSTVVSLLLALWVTRNILKQVKSVAEGLEKLAEGDLNVELNISSGDAFGLLARSTAGLVANLRRYTLFSNNIGEGKFDKSIEFINPKDVLGASLTAMRDKLEHVSQEGEKRNWATQGIASSGEILRTNTGNPDGLYNGILTFLVKYIKANQGALFVVPGKEDKFLEMVACYAYDRKKYLKKRFEFGEGLVGQAVLEKEYIYLTDIPDNYISITSGLGDANPTSIIVIPLIINEEIQGVLELASFKEIKEHEISFLLKVSESIASTLGTVKTNMHTARLLQESQEMTEQLRSQEEELRQNMEEMNATQENMQKVSLDLASQLETIDRGLASIHFSPSGHILKANNNFQELMGYEEREIVDKHHSIFVSPEEIHTDEYKRFWEELRSGKFSKGEFRRIAKNGEEVWIKGIYNPVKDENGVVVKIIKIAVDITGKSKKKLPDNLYQ